jgi:peptidoglycan/LPS O-acetylase OafA/YrhL
MSAKPRLASLDVLRFLAIALVLGRHRQPPETGVWFVDTLSSAWFQGGWVGVDLFFVLSGFLVGGLLFKEARAFGDVRIWRFLIRRGFKVYPAFYVMLLFTVAYRWLFVPDFDLTRTASEVLFLQNYVPPIWSHTWSLAVEEHFYILLPLVFLACGSSADFESLCKRVIYVGVSICVLAMLLRCLTAFQHPVFDMRKQMFPTHLRLDALFIGVILAAANSLQFTGFNSARKQWKVSTFAAVVGFLPAFLIPIGSHWYLHTVGFLVLSISSGAALVAALGAPSLQSPGAIGKACVLIGKHSYSIYLWHMAVEKWGPVWLARAGFSGGEVESFLMYICCSIGIGIFFSILIESPMLKVRDRFFPSRDAQLNS